MSVVPCLWCIFTCVCVCSPCTAPDLSLPQDYIAIAVQPQYAVYVPHTGGRYQVKRFRKAQVMQHCRL